MGTWQGQRPCQNLPERRGGEGRSTASHGFTLSPSFNSNIEKPDLKLISSAAFRASLPTVRDGSSEESTISSLGRELGEANHSRTDIASLSMLIKHHCQTAKRFSSVARTRASLSVNHLQVCGFLLFFFFNFLKQLLKINECKPVCQLPTSVSPEGITSCV